LSDCVIFSENFMMIISSFKKLMHLHYLSITLQKFLIIYFLLIKNY
jgi:hypothetical protein